MWKSIFRRVNENKASRARESSNDDPGIEMPFLPTGDSSVAPEGQADVDPASTSAPNDSSAAAPSASRRSRRRVLALNLNLTSSHTRNSTSHGQTNGHSGESKPRSWREDLKDVIKARIEMKIREFAEQGNTRTQLIDAAFCGKIDEVKSLLSSPGETTGNNAATDGQKPNPNIRSEAESVLMIAAWKGLDARVIQFLVEKGRANVNVSIHEDEEDDKDWRKHVVDLKGELALALDELGSWEDHPILSTGPLTPLCLAAWAGSLDCCKALVEQQKLSPSVIDGSTTEIPAERKQPITPALTAAVLGGSVKCVEYLVAENRTIPDIEAGLSPKLTPLHHAALEGNLEIMELLLGSEKEKREVNNTGFQGYTPLHYAAYEGHDKIVSKLIMSGARRDTPLPSEFGIMDTPLHLAATKGHSKVTKNLITDPTLCGLDACNGSALSALHMAAAGGHAVIVDQLIKAKCIPHWHAEAENMRTPLYLAVLNGREEVFYLLMKAAERDPDRPSDKEMGALLHLAASTGHLGITDVIIQAGCAINERDDMGFTALHLAAMKGHVGVVSRLLEDKNTEVIAKSTGFGEKTALHLAVMYGHEDVVNALIPATDIEKLDVPDETGYTALHTAVFWNKQDSIIRLLVNSKFSVNARDHGGATPMHVAAYRGRPDIMTFLWEKEGDIYARDQYGCTPFSKSTLGGYHNILGFIEGILDRSVSLKDEKELLEEDQRVKQLEEEQRVKQLKERQRAGQIEEGQRVDEIEEGQRVDEIEEGQRAGQIEEGQRVDEIEEWQRVDEIEEGQRVGQREEGQTAGQLEERQREMNRAENAHVLQSNKLAFTFKTLRQGTDEEERFNGEMHSLIDFKAEGMRKLLQHPLCEAFIKLKWQKAKFLFIIIPTLRLFLAIALTYFVMNLFREPCIQETCMPVKNGTACFDECRERNLETADQRRRFLQERVDINIFWYIMLVIGFVLLLIEAAQVVLSWRKRPRPAVYPIQGQLREPILTPPHQEQQEQARREENVEGQTWQSRFRAIPCTVKQILKKYLWNGAQVSILVSTAVLILHPDYPDYTLPTWKYYIAAIDVYLSWVGILCLLRRFPFFGVYVQMFWIILKEVGKFLLAFCPLIIAFTAGFAVVFAGRRTFQNFFEGIVSTLVMMTGELGYADLLLNLGTGEGRGERRLELNFTPLSEFIFVMFLFLVVIVTINLLIGLAVSDIQVLQWDARLETLVLQVQLIADLEATFLQLPHMILETTLLQLPPLKDWILLGSRFYEQSYTVSCDDPSEQNGLSKRIVDSAYKLALSRQPKKAQVDVSRSDTANGYATHVDGNNADTMKTELIEILHLLNTERVNSGQAAETIMTKIKELRRAINGDLRNV